MNSDALVRDLQFGPIFNGSLHSFFPAFCWSFQFPRAIKIFRTAKQFLDRTPPFTGSWPGKESALRPQRNIFRQNEIKNLRRTAFDNSPVLFLFYIFQYHVFIVHLVLACWQPEHLRIKWPLPLVTLFFDDPLPIGVRFSGFDGI